MSCLPLFSSLSRQYPRNFQLCSSICVPPSIIAGTVFASGTLFAEELLQPRLFSFAGDRAFHALVMLPAFLALAVA